MRINEEENRMGQREFVIAGAGLAMTPLVGDAIAAAQEKGTKASVGAGSIKAHAYAAPNATIPPPANDHRAAAARPE